MRTATAAVLTAFVISLTACGGGTPVSSSTSSSTAPPAAVTIKGFAFNPHAVTVHVGESLTFTNQDNQAHTATADDSSFDLGAIAPGSTASHRFEKAGTFSFHCSFHPFMTATITVTG